MSFPLVALLLLLEKMSPIIGVTGARTPRPATDVASKAISLQSVMCRCLHIFKRGLQLDKQTAVNDLTLHAMELPLTLILILVHSCLALALIPHLRPIVVIIPLPNHLPPWVIEKLTMP